MATKKKSNRIDDATRANIIVDLQSEMPVKDIIEKYGVSQGSVYGIRKELEESDTNAQIETAKKVTPAVLTEVVDNLPEQAKEEAHSLAENVEGLRKLDKKFQETGIHLANKIMELSNKKDLTPGEMHTLTKAFNETVQAFSTASTTINMVQNGENAGGDTHLNFFKQTLRN